MKFLSLIAAASTASVLASCSKQAAPISPLTQPAISTVYAASVFVATTHERFTQIRVEGIQSGRPSFIVRYFGRQDGYDHFLLEGKDGLVPVKLPITTPPPISYKERPFSPQMTNCFIPFTC